MAARALLVGLNTYPDPRNNLNSCVADTLAFKALLTDTCGFDPGNIALLHNQDATLDNVRAGLDTLFAGAQAGDNLVFFESSHGYRYTDGDTMVEVLCLYDQFFKDSELSQRTQSLPPDVLSVVLDACHSGGMNKLFFPGGDVQVARAKIWQPSEDEIVREAQLYSQVTKFKFFGRSSTGDTGAVAKNLVFDPVGVAAPKALDQGAVDLNGALFAACLADQTAAVPANRRGDKDWVDFTTSLLLNLAQGAVQALSGQKDFSIQANQPQMPTPPAGADKGWFDDALGFVQKAAPVALPIIMSLA